MYTVRENDLYIGYRFKVHAVLKDGSMKVIPPQNIMWATCGTIQVNGGVVTYLGEKGDKVIAKIINKRKEIVASDEIYITDENDLYDDWEFGISGLSKGDDSKLIRTRNAKTRDFVIDMASGRIATDFDGILDFGRVKDSEGNEFVKIPTLYRKFDGNELVISKYKKDKDYEVYPCFISPVDGRILEEIAIGCYKGSVDEKGHLISQSRKTRVKGVLNELKCKIVPVNKYNYYFLRNEAVNQLLRDLFLVVFASRSFSSIFKNQSGVDPKKTPTGATDGHIDFIFTYPQNCCFYNFENRSFKFFGIEDPFDGGVEWIDDMFSVPELTTENSACYLINPQRNRGKEDEPEDFVKTEFNGGNIKALQMIKLKSGTYLMPISLTKKVDEYFSDSVFYMKDKSGNDHIINGISSYVDSDKKKGLWSYSSVTEDFEAYTRLCYSERVKSEGVK